MITSLKFEPIILAVFPSLPGEKITSAELDLLVSEKLSKFADSVVATWHAEIFGDVYKGFRDDFTGDHGDVRSDIIKEVCAYFAVFTTEYVHKFKLFADDEPGIIRPGQKIPAKNCGENVASATGTDALIQKALKKVAVEVNANPEMSDRKLRRLIDSTLANMLDDPYEFEEYDEACYEIYTRVKDI
jgi:hypothetical protein